ncbi:hypothetical protein CYY_000349 [Polysphondylium violaceum]|uniref:Ornithine cyclodeaminase n=1 Tax=Polysphondylium violaceum TaxID=133409 RepID=A0A8J4Q308_9MYCE|nr:hypothetical protein CYY_000349 [Polysphondylium violaceum]
MLIIKESDVYTLLKLQESIDVNENVFRLHSDSKVDCPSRTLIKVVDNGNNNDIGKSGEAGSVDNSSKPTTTTATPTTNLCYFKPAYVEGNGVGLKIVSVFPDNIKKGLPTIPATIVLLDENTGFTKAIVGATYLTGVRTAAGSAVVAKRFASEESKVLTIFGTGLQAQLHLQMILLVRKSIEKVVVVSKSLDRALAFIKESQEKLKDSKEITLSKDIEFVAELDGNKAVQDSDIVVTATAATPTPLFDGAVLVEKAKLKKIVVLSVGSSTPANRETDTFLFKNSNVIVDDINSCSKSGELSIPETEEKGFNSSTHIRGELGDVLTGKKPLDASNNLILFKSAGTAIQDIATAALVYQRAKELGIGIDVNLD